MTLEKEKRFIRVIRAVKDPDRVAETTQASRVVELEGIFKKLGVDIADCRRQGWAGLAKDEVTIALMPYGHFDNPIALLIAGNNRVKAPPQYRVVRLMEKDQIIQPRPVFPSGDLHKDQDIVLTLFKNF